MWWSRPRVVFAWSLSFVSCGGVSTRTDEAGDDAPTGGGTDAGGVAGTGGASTGATSTGGTGATSTGGIGATSTGGTGATSTGGIGATSTGGAGASPRGGTGAVPDVPERCFESIGDAVRCENAGSRVQDAFSERVEGATSIQDCYRACMARPDCTAVTDYFSEPPLDICVLRSGQCTPTTPVAAEEDAAKEYRKVCTDRGMCRFEYLGDGVRCAETYPYPTRLESATSRADCDRACLDDANCSGVIDYFWIGDIAGCYLYTSTCASPETLPPGDTGHTLRRLCD